MPHSKKKGSPISFKHLLLLLLIVLFFGVITLYDYSKRNINSSQLNSQINTPTPRYTQNKLAEIQIGDKVITAEVADTDSLRQRGLSYRENLEADSGVLFIFEYSPKEKVNYVLEVNAGFTDKYSIEMGDVVNIQLKY